MFFMEERRLLAVIMLAFAFSIFLVSAKTIPIDNQASCEKAQGEWQYLSPENAESRFECVCNEYIGSEQVKLWNGISCVIITEDIRCIKTGGFWESNKCECTTGKWVPQFGCQFAVHDSNYPIMILLIILSIAIIILLIFLIKILLNKSKKRRKNGE